MPRRTRSILKWSAIVIVGMILIVVIGGKILLNSSVARNIATKQLSEQLGLPIEVDSLDIGDTTTASIRVPDTKAGDSSYTLKVGMIDTDVSLINLIDGSVKPTYVNVTDAELFLRFDADGNLLNEMPKPKSGGSSSDMQIPKVTLKKSTVRLQQVGKPEMKITGISGVFEEVPNGFTLKGETTESEWGVWQVAAKFDATFQTGHIVLSSVDGHLTDERLRSIPYIPNVVWEHVKASGTAKGTITFDYSPKTEFQYRVELHPQGAEIVVPDAEVTLKNATGTIIVADSKLIIKDGNVALANGTGTIDAIYNWAGASSIITLDIAGNGIDVQKLPASWGLPKSIEGQLRAKSENMKIVVEPGGKWTTTGSGTGDIENAKLAGLDAEIKLKLGSTGSGFRFQTMLEND